MKRFSVVQKILVGFFSVLMVSTMVSAAIRESNQDDAIPSVSYSFFNHTNLTTTSGDTIIAVGGTTTVYTKSYRVPANVKYFSHEFKATSSGTVNLTITREVKSSPFAVEGAADADAILVSSTAVTLTSTAKYGASIDIPGGFEYYRYRIVGTGNNDATTTVTGRANSN